ncbi:hypothetical protein ACFFOM_04260 [Microlunatus capsulatus]|uniref:Uncharacterized protein n=1 Tax=Microlunatus capsulatus TaxID=99117 RepID=A0ABS4Z4F7_9ACTN|nr:hypothetical protein [Microlunatus capsulatus]MBP2415927.1 hypothetical protein [Microlunatus capsulatus]
MRRAAGVALACLGLLLASPPLTPSAATVDRPFATSSPFNTAVPAGTRTDPASAAMVARATRTRQLHANLVAYGIPVLTATPSTPRHRVTCSMAAAWGPCPLTRQALPIPLDARPSTGDDGALVVVDPATGTIGEYWQARRSGSGWTASYGAVNDLAGSGWGGSSTGAGASRLAGVVRVREIRAGLIPHALVLQSDNVCAGTVRPPALKTDGTSRRTDCLPEGARLQLDPALDLAEVPGLTPGERTVARALQVYGGYVIDRAGTPLSASFERAPDATASSPGAVYRAAGFGWDYDGMDAVPWHRLRVLRTWQG